MAGIINIFKRSSIYDDAGDLRISEQNPLTQLLQGLKVSDLDFDGNYLKIKEGSPLAQALQAGDLSFTGAIQDTGGFNSPRTDQTPIAGTTYSSTDGTWHTLYTVTEGKTLYITQVSFSTENATFSACLIGSGNGEDYNIFVNNASSITITFTTPLKYTSETVVQWKFSASATHHIAFTGWEE